MRLNRKGYMLVEIILASVIAFGIAYFILDMTIKLKNKNDDLLVETQVMTDKTIINNKLMKYAIDKGQEFDCSKLTVEGNKISYDGDTIDILNGYTNIEYNSNNCRVDVDKATISVHIGLDVPQMADKNFDINLNYRYRIIDTEVPTCTLKVDGNTVSFDTREDDGVINNYGLSFNSSEPDYNKTESLEISVGTFTGYVKDLVGNEGSCSVSIITADGNFTYTCSKSFDDCIGNGLFSYSGACYKEKKPTAYPCPEGKKCEKCIYHDSSHCYDCLGVACYYKVCAYNGCSGGWERRDDGCYKYNQEYCSYTIANTNPPIYSCPDGYIQVKDNYCYKIND